MKKNQVGNMKNHCLNVISIIALNLASTVAISVVGLAPANAQRSSLINAPLVCNRGDMTDGLVKWRFVTHQYGRNYYRAQELHGSRWNNVSCLERERTRTIRGRSLPGDVKKCIIAGVMAAPGKRSPRAETVASPGRRIPGLGLVRAVRRVGGACLISIVE
jgi:hypothetical protein